MSIARIRTAALTMVAVLALTLTALVGISGAAQASYPDPPSGDRTGCPRGAVCVYPSDSWNGGNPSYVFWSYAAHKIYNQYGSHRVYNNQTGGAGAYLCENGNGTSCAYYIPAGTYNDYNLTPINSVKLTP